MYRIVNTINYRNSWIHRHPVFAERGEGVMVILDPNQIKEPPEISGQTVTIYKPDGKIVQFVVGSSEAPHSLVGIFFKDVFSDEIPLGSQVEW